MIGYGLLLVLGSIIVLIIAAVQALQNRTYATGTGTVMGTVIRKQSRKVDKRTYYELTVSYMVDGTAYEKVAGATLSEFNEIIEGDKLELCYKLDNPKKAVRPMELNPRTVRILLMVGAAMLVIGIVLFVVGRM